MNNKALNREFQNNMLVEKKRFNAKSGFTDSEEEDESTRCNFHILDFHSLSLLIYFLKF